MIEAVSAFGIQNRLMALKLACKAATNGIAVITGDDSRSDGYATFVMAFARLVVAVEQVKAALPESEYENAFAAEVMRLSQAVQVRAAIKRGNEGAVW